MANVFVYANNVNTTLASPITSTATSLTLSSSTNLPTLSAGQQMALTLNDAATQSVFEVMYVTAITGATCTVVRGQEGTTAQSWLAGDYAYSDATAGVFRALAGSGSIVGSGYVYLGNGLYLQWGTKTSVPADGTSNASVTFPIAFPNNCFTVNTTIQNNFQTNSWALTPATTSSKTTTGFTISVGGAPPNISATVSVDYFALGN